MSTSPLSFTAIVDDMDDQIQWGDEQSWSHNSNKSFYNGTYHHAKQVDASFTFNFVGNSVAVYGLVPAGENAEGTYTIDNLNNITFVPQPGSTLLFQYATLAFNGSHSLTVNSNSTNGLIVDYITYETSYASLASTDLSCSSSSAPSASSSSVATSDHIGATAAGLIGGAVGCAVFIVFSTIFLYFLYRRRQRGQSGGIDSILDKFVAPSGSDHSSVSPTTMPPSAQFRQILERHQPNWSSQQLYQPQPSPSPAPSPAIQPGRLSGHTPIAAAMTQSKSSPGPPPSRLPDPAPPPPGPTPPRRPALIIDPPSTHKRTMSSSNSDANGTHRRIARWVQSIRQSGSPMVVQNQ